MQTYHLHITGQVQGVGFRPFVFIQARKLGVHGWVKNTIDGVHIRFNASDRNEAERFKELILINAPRLSIITGHSLVEKRKESWKDFSIIQSDEKGEANLMITPDFAMCDDCKQELLDPSNKRFQYPFITCTNCGPRYSIITNLPYDRPYTTMNPFVMCSDCDVEYNDPTNRRYYSQTNSCPECAVQLSFFRSNGSEVNLDSVHSQIQFIVDRLREGAILAIKGIGGYLLICDAGNAGVVQKLRKRKQRPTKAFAMMFPDVDSIKKELVWHEKAEKYLTGPVSPIVLLRRIKVAVSSYAYQDIAPGLDSIGVMIPYTPLYELILDRFGHAIIATSGNISNEPIIFDNQGAIHNLSHIADYIVTNNRDIVAPQDDSVINFSGKYRKPIIYRRSRGLAPGYLDEKLELPGRTILAVGGELKSSFTLLYNHLCFISQYLGDLEDYGTQKAFKQTLDHFISLFRTQPELILHDLHPMYFSTQLATEYATKYNVSRKAIQHHEAHFTAVMGEHNLFKMNQVVLGCIWDGTGYGKDGQIWGGEIFVYENGSIRRLVQLSYFDFILGDKMPREPRISALAIGYKVEEAEKLLQEKFSDTEWKVYQTLLKSPQSLKTSSMGRLFDAVASFTLDVDVCSYEGEAAMFLEVAARDYFESNHSNVFSPFNLVKNHKGDLDTHELIKNILHARKAGTDKGEIAFKFHCTLVEWIADLIQHLAVKRVAFSGGVFQNALLVDLMIMRLSDKCSLYFHEKLSPNDECISFGQLMHHINDVDSND